MVKLTDVSGIGPVAAKLLAERNIKTVAALASISLAELQKIPGFNGEIRARAVKKAASDCLHTVTKQSAAPTKPVKTVQTPVKKIAGEKAKTSQALGQTETDQTANKKDKKDSKKKEKIKDKDKDKDKKDKNKKSSKKKGKNKKK
jgi:hypothetical protein